MVITHQNFHDRIYAYSSVDKLTFGNVDYMWRGRCLMCKIGTLASDAMIPYEDPWLPSDGYICQLQSCSFFCLYFEDFKQSSYAPHAELPLHQNVDSCLRSALAYPTTQSPKIWSAFAAVLGDPCFKYLASLQLDCCLAERVHYQTPTTTHLLKIVIQLQRSDQPWHALSNQFPWIGGFELKRDLWLSWIIPSPIHAHKISF